MGTHPIFESDFDCLTDIMELPHLGSHCHFAECNRLDFLPMKCRGCSQSFCSEHFGLDIHNCSKSGIVDRQVPTCPLCNKPVPLGTSNKPPDQIVNDHIERNCDSQAAAKKSQEKRRSLLRKEMQNKGVDSSILRALQAPRLSEAPFPKRPRLHSKQKQRSVRSGSNGKGHKAFDPGSAGQHDKTGRSKTRAARST